MDSLLTSEGSCYFILISKQKLASISVNPKNGNLDQELNNPKI